MKMGQCSSTEFPPNYAEETDQQSLDLSFNKTPKPSFLRRHSLASSWVNKKFNRMGGKNGVSAAFNLLDHNSKSNLVNINYAPEEELMTLPGITRQIAKQIVDYRTKIGGFKKIEDLALVSGVGASLMQSVKSEVTIKKKTISHSSSRAQSIDSLPSVDSVRSQKSLHQLLKGNQNVMIRPLCINSASIFELMLIPGVDQELAANIVLYREKKGPFSNINELMKVRGLNSKVLDLLKAYVFVSDASHFPLSVNSTCNSALSRQLLCGHRRSTSAPVDIDGSFNAESSAVCIPTELRVPHDLSSDLFELLSLSSQRPTTCYTFNEHYNGHPVIRLATWNLQQVTKEKISNPGVLEVVCRTILENGFSVLALQEIKDQEVPQIICNELNESRLRRVREWPGPKGIWNWVVSEEPSISSLQGCEYAGFIYNCKYKIQLMSHSVLHLNNNNRSFNKGLRKPYSVHFKINNYDLLIVNLHISQADLDAGANVNIIEEENEEDSTHDDLPKEHVEVNLMSFLKTLLSDLQNRLKNYPKTILLGNFNMLSLESFFKLLQNSSYFNVISSHCSTCISGNRNCDNIWIETKNKELYTGRCGVIRTGLSHMAIPSGWSWGGTASNYCPVFCDILTT